MFPKELDVTLHDSPGHDRTRPLHPCSNEADEDREDQAQYAQPDRHPESRQHLALLPVIVHPDEVPAWRFGSQFAKEFFHSDRPMVLRLTDPGKAQDHE